MIPERNYYGTLEVPRSASAEDIRMSYRRLAKKYHPDLNPGDRGAEDRFKSMKGAYDILSNAKSRQAYDLKAEGKFTEHLRQTAPMRAARRRRSRQDEGWNLAPFT